MERSEDVWTQAHDHARAFLRRYGDTWTRNHRDDLVQESAMAAWQWVRRAQDQERFWAAVRTIARRIRSRAIGVVERRVRAQRDACVPRHGCTATGDADAPRVDDSRYLIAGRRVPSRWAMPCLQRVLERLPLIDQRLLLGFYEGFCCAELAARCGRTEECVKTRIHRARRRVQREIEASVRAAGDLDES